MRTKTIVLLALAVAAFVFGAANQYWYPGETFSKASVIYVIVSCLLIFTWYRLDARQAGYRPSPWLDLGVVAIALLALPYFFFRTRGAKRGFLAVGAALAFIVATNLLSIAGAYAAYYGLQV